MGKILRVPGAVLAVVLAGAVPAGAGEVTVEGAELQRQADGSYRVSVTLRHADTGWEHYADLWELLAPDGTVLGARVLAHPHVNEQPFTRSLSGVTIPPGLDRVIVRGRDSEHGYGEGTLEVRVPR